MATASIGTAWIQIKPSLSGISKDIEKQLGGASRVGGASMQSNLKNVFNGLGGNIQSIFSSAFQRVTSTAKTLFTAGLGSAIGLLGSQLNSAFRRADILNNFPKIMENLNIPVKKSAAAIQTLSNRLTGLPTSLDAGAQGVERFTTKTKDVKKATNWFLALNDAVLASAAPMDLQSAATEQFIQMITVGKPDMMAWRTVIRAMPAQMNQLARSMGYVSGDAGGDLYEAFLKGKVSANDLMNQIVKLDKNGGKNITSFSKQARNATGGFTTSISNMKIAVTRSITTALNRISGMPQAISGVGIAIEGLLDGKLSTKKAMGMINNFFEKMGQGLGGIIEKLVPFVANAMASLATMIADNFSKFVSDSKRSKTMIQGFVNLFVAVAHAGGEIALAILPLVPEIIGEIGKELMKPQNAVPIFTGMGVLFGFGLAKTLAGNFKKMATNSIARFFGKILGKNKAADAAADSIDKLSRAANRAPKTFKFGDSISSFFKNIGKSLSDAADAILDPLKTLAKGSTQILKDLLTGIGQSIAGFFGTLSNPELLIGIGIFAAAAGAVALAILMIGGAVGTVTPGLSNFYYNVLQPMGTFLLTTFVVAVSVVTDALIRLTNQAAIPLVNVVSGGLTKAFNAIGGVITSAGNAVSKVVDSISKGISRVIDSIANLISKVGKQDWYGTGYGITRNFTAGLIDGLIDLLQDSLNKIIDHVIDIPGIGNALKAVGVKADPVNLKSFKLGRRAFGGPIFGEGSDMSDSIPLMVSNGEYVIRAASARKIGYSNLDSMNETGEVRGGGDVYNIYPPKEFAGDYDTLADYISNKIALKRKRVMG